MEFIPLEREQQIEQIADATGINIIFKHNTTCPISNSVIRNLKAEGDILPEGVPVYYLDLLTYRDISEAIAERFEVEHESPQLLVIKNGECIFNESLYKINAEETAEVIRENE